LKAKDFYTLKYVCLISKFIGQAANMVEDQLRIAADYIRAHRYEEARRLLQTLDHPKAREWLYRIDQIQRQQYAQMVPNSASATDYYPQPIPLAVPDNRVGLGRFLLAIIGAVFGAVLGIILWTAVAYFTEYETVFVSLIVGVLVGGGAVLFSRRRGLPIQFVAAIIALLGVAVGKYMAVYFIAVGQYIRMGGTVGDILNTVSPFAPATTKQVLQDISNNSNYLDIVFAALAMFAAIGITARSRRR
jgi:hypothetical protein